MTTLSTLRRLPESDFYEYGYPRVSDIVIVNFASRKEVDVAVISDPTMCESAYNDIYGYGARLRDVMLGKQRCAVLDILECDDGFTLVDTMSDMICEYAQDFSEEDSMLVEQVEKIIRKKLPETFIVGEHAPRGSSLILIGTIPL